MNRTWPGFFAFCLLAGAAGCGSDGGMTPSANTPAGPTLPGPPRPAGKTNVFVWPANAVTEANLASGLGRTAFAPERLRTCLSCEAELAGRLAAASVQEREAAARSAGFKDVAGNEAMIALALRAFDALQRLRAIDKLANNVSRGNTDTGTSAILLSARRDSLGAVRAECMEMGVTEADLLLLHEHSAELLKLGERRTIQEAAAPPGG